MLRNTPLKEDMFQKYLDQVRGWRETKNAGENCGDGGEGGGGGGWESLACNVS